jgi:hypothetical protein
LATLWAQKYVDKLRAQAALGELPGAQLADKVKGSLRFASSQAWAKTERLLAAEIPKQRLDPDLIDPWQIAEDLGIYLRRQRKVVGRASRWLAFRCRSRRSVAG